MTRTQMNHMTALKNFVDSKQSTAVQSFAAADLSQDGERAVEDQRQAEKLGENSLHRQQSHLLSCLERTTVGKRLLCIRHGPNVLRKC